MRLRNHAAIIVGGGLTGLMASLRLRGRYVAIATKIYPTQSHSGAAQGGFNAARSAGDSIDSHIADTIKGSDYLADQDAVEVMCSEAPEVIDELDRLGVMSSRTEEGGLAQRPLGGSSNARTCYAADMSGHVVLQTLYEQVLRARISLYAEWHLLDLLIEEGQVAGAVFWNLPEARLEVVPRLGGPARHRRTRTRVREDDQRPGVDRRRSGNRLQPGRRRLRSRVRPIPSHDALWHQRARVGRRARGGRIPAKRDRRAIHGAVCRESDGACAARRGVAIDRDRAA